MMNSGAAASSGLWAARALPASAAAGVRPPGVFPYTRLAIGNVVNAPGKWVSNFVNHQRTHYAGAVGAAVGVPVVAPAVTLEQMAALRQARADYNEAQQRWRDDSTPPYPTEEMLARPRALEPHVAAAHVRVMAQKVEALQLAEDLREHHLEQNAREQAYARGQPYYVPHGGAPMPQQPPPPTRRVLGTHVVRSPW